MDDEDDRQLLDILGDVDALNDYLHGSNGKSIDEDDVTNAAYGSDGSFFSTDTALSNPGLKDGSCADFSVDSGSALPLSSSLSFIEDELGSEDSSGNDDQPFDILQKSLLEADITEQTLAQEALLDAQPAPTLVQAPVSFPSIVPGNIGGTVNVVTPAGQFIQGVSQIPNGSAQHIQVLGSFGTTTGGVMTLSNLERTPQLVLRPPLATSNTQVLAPTQAQGFKNIPLQNIIIQRGPGGTQALVRPIQPKPLQTGAQTVYSVGLQSASSANAVNVANASGQYTANGSIVVQSSLEQGTASAGQFILPGSLAITPATSIQNGPTDANANTLITTQNTVQIVAGPNFTTAGQLILNQRVVNEAVTQTRSNASPAPVQGRLTLVAGQTQVPGCPVQRLLVTQTTNCASLSPLPQASAVMQEQDYTQGCSSPALKLSTIHATKPITQDSTLNPQVVSQLRPAPLTRGGMILQQVRKDHVGVLTPDKTRFTSFENVLQKLLPYNVFQGAPQSADEFTQVDDEFELVASQVLTKTHAMISKYRKLLMVEAERSSPSSEIVMIDRTFNQEERGTLTQEKRTVMVDPDGFLEDFCCGVRSSLWSEPSPPPPPPPPPVPDPREGYSHSDTRSPDSPSSFRTELRPPYGDPGGGYAQKHHKHNLKRTQQQIYSHNSSGQASPYTPGHYQTTHSNQTTFTSPTHTDTDSALEAAVNSILEC